MSAVRGKNLRSGDLAEQLGLVILQSVALVAPVPRTEDVGIDAVVTLLREFESTRYIAEDSFFVQIKSASVSSIEFVREGVNWLYNLELPFFVASVDRATSSLNLYCAHRLSDAFITNHAREKLILHLDDLDTADELVAQDETNVHIGPPVVSWSITQPATDKNFANTFYAIVKEHIKVARSNIRTRDVGWAEYVRWRSNELPRKIGFKVTSSRTSEERLSAAAEEMMPYFFVWHEEILRTRNWEEARSLFSLLEKTKKLIEDGVLPSNFAPSPRINDTDEG